MLTSPGRVEWKSVSSCEATGRAFGTSLHLLVTRAAMQDRSIRIVHDILTDFDKACSRFRPDSDLVRLNREAGNWHGTNELLFDAIEVAMEAAERTNGAVDPTVGQALIYAGYDADFVEVVRRTTAQVSSSRHSAAAKRTPSWKDVELDRARRRVRVPAGVQLDLGATAKGLAADLCAEAILYEFPDDGVLVNLGGDIAMMGKPQSGGWAVQLSAESVAAPDFSSEKIAVTHGGLATSNIDTRSWRIGGERQHHIIDPHTQSPSESDIVTASVIAMSCREANAGSTAAIVSGSSVVPWLEENELPARLVMRDGSTHRVAGWPTGVAA